MRYSIFVYIFTFTNEIYTFLSVMLLFNVLQFHLKNYLKDLFCGRSSCNQLSLILFGKGFMILFLLSYFNPQLRTCLLILERGEGRDKERERNINVREKH